MSDGAKYDPPPSDEDVARMRAALTLIAAIHVRKETHLGRARFSGIEQGCIYCIAKQGLTGDEAVAADLVTALQKLESHETDPHAEKTQ